jgi:hypothetical protein
MRRISLVTAVIAAALVAAGPARAVVLVNAPSPLTKDCGALIKVGIRYQASSGGSRRAKVSIRTVNGATVFHRSATAGAHWRYWTYHPRCGRRYDVRYVTSSGKVTFPVRIRAAG